jgi:hypothetical protein
LFGIDEGFDGNQYGFPVNSNYSEVPFDDFERNIRRFMQG